jgi:Tol biopolymer transport system component
MTSWRFALPRAALFVCGLLLLAVFPPANAQDEFGKNKVQYHDFEWSFLQTDHFDVYFYQNGQPIAEFVAVEAESAYASIRKLFRYQLVNRVPIVLYNSHNDFQQTNVVSEYLEEGIGGVTELFKNRVVIPFEGGYGSFQHVLHHELVHAVINDMFYGGSIQSIITNNITLQLPAWFNEGLSEYASLQWDTNSDMYLRDATIGESLPAIPQLSGYAAYRCGQSVWWYIARKYGEQKIGEILNRIKSTRSVEAGFKGAVGLGVQELSERWQKEQKVLYWPDIAKREDPADYARRLTDHKKDGGFYNTSPTISPQGDRIAFISNRDDFFNLYLMSATDGKVLDKLIDGQTTENLEELHLLTPGLSWSPDGKRLALATKAGAEDAILLLEVEGGDYEKLTFGLEGIFSVAWSPLGDKLAFIGNSARESDIYVYDLAGKSLTNLTSDPFADETPQWTPDGRSILFSSDRGGYAVGTQVRMDTVDSHQFDLYSIDLATRAVKRLTQWPNSNETSPVVSPDGKRVLFVSDKNGINNIFLLNLDSGQCRPVTNSLSGVYQLSITRDGSKLTFSSLYKSGFDIFVMRNPFDKTVSQAELEPTEYYRMKFTPKEAQPPAALAGEKKPAAQDSTQMLGENIQIDFSNYVFKDQANAAVPTDSLIAKMVPITNNLDENGNFKINKYKLNFTPDIIYGNAGYDTFYGVNGSTIFAFSDLLGDHQIILGTNLMVDLKNSDYGFQYYYLPNRIDWGFGASHSARFVYLYDQDDPYSLSLYRFRMYGASLNAQLPISRFNRVEFGLSWYNILKENLDRLDYPSQTRSMLIPGVAYVHDTILWGYVSPMRGTRYRFDVFGTPKVGSNGLSFTNVQGDYRTYLSLGRLYSVALRLAGGASLGRNPQKFIIGGVENWIAPVFTGGAIPFVNAEDYVFLQAGLPLRGYDYNAQIGSRFALFNFEFRYPLFAFLQAGPLPLALQNFGGVLFLDAGTAWNSNRELHLFQKSSGGLFRTDDLLIGMGAGSRMLLFFFLLRFDVGWGFDGKDFTKPKYYFSLGYDY